jgi:hypothetical protein
MVFGLFSENNTPGILIAAEYHSINANVSAPAKHLRKRLNSGIFNGSFTSFSATIRLLFISYLHLRYRGHNEID